MVVPSKSCFCLVIIFGPGRDALVFAGLVVAPDPVENEGYKPISEARITIKARMAQW
ncbi:hypothetical protein QBC32DRAFT_310811 [Pseudoneurospora amorphoporcata]|uniref:Uncharacterized protein n=1 Tax=Pseudoneurospora amorphoporcata TaxID=241081 RepID=A0AAN6P4W7_9PEZI|nr:hypothetical protein QBC32DRAFT_310811 [Pseudoneurospora amorphoporcata]